jgi:hypothetical protein
MSDDPMSMAPEDRRERYARAIWELNSDLGAMDHLLLHHPAVGAAIAVADAELNAYFGNLVACEAENARLRRMLQEMRP